jgi:hypothetical protein
MHLVNIIDLIVDLGLPVMLIYGDSDMIRLDTLSQNRLAVIPGRLVSWTELMS